MWYFLFYERRKRREKKRIKLKIYLGTLVLSRALFLCNAFVHHLNDTRTIEISLLIVVAVVVVASVIVVVVGWCWYCCDCFVAFEIVTVPRVGLPFYSIVFLFATFFHFCLVSSFFFGLMMWFWRRWIACEFLKHLNGWHASKIYGNSMYMVYYGPIQTGQRGKWQNEE